ncbi:MAG: GNAT family N-acetyltransferase [Methylophilaceae bacterium]|nr:GNAT family N-acetyltransferase [Methylophilaceae bacterium]
MSNQNNFTVQEVSWQTAQTALSQIRLEVFVHEQQVPMHLELDGLDEQALHLLALNHAGEAIGCARILLPADLRPASIGRMAVIKAWRNKGVGTALLQAAVKICRQLNWKNVTLSAQTHAIGFYARAGFTLCSAEYLDAGILHRDMMLNLSD